MSNKFFRFNNKGKRQSMVMIISHHHCFENLPFGRLNCWLVLGRRLVQLQYEGFSNSNNNACLTHFSTELEMIHNLSFPNKQLGSNSLN